MGKLFDFENIVLIADWIAYDSENLEVYDRDMDKPHMEYVVKLLDTLKAIHPSVVHYDSPAKFIDNIAKHKNDIVLPFWSGEKSRNRYAVIPAVCEAAQIKYLGGDTYTKTVCNDKTLSKMLCESAGLATPKGYTITTKNDLDGLDRLTYPIVVKPLFEGTSLGISERNLVQSKEEAIPVILDLLVEFDQPVVAEEFITGKEVSVCLVGWRDNIRAWEAAERYVVGNDDYFLTRLYAFHEKKTYLIPLELRSVTTDIPADVFNACCRLFNYLDKVEFMRIDGRLNGSKFTVIELTPETHLGESVEFCGSFIVTGKYDYEAVIRMMIKNCLERYENI